ncbi:MAG: holo-ACP synthase [Puniceicoccales bacterium]|jgi:holo-[acyl-carrier protein] synthase|nr:holo-ACP synthase [Puniceicoccales bacterium]
MEKIIGVGTDIVEIARIRAAHQRHGNRFLRRIFTDGEVAYAFRFRDPYPSLAARFAAKEAVAKALGTGIGTSVSFRQIEILCDAKNAPKIRLNNYDPEGNAAGRRIFLSLSHIRHLAVAFVTIQSSPVGV